VGVNSAFHEIVAPGVSATYVVLLSVLAFPFVTALLANVAIAVPVQSLLGYSVKVTVPAAAFPLPVLTVATSFGNQFCAVLTEEVSFTAKHSVVSFVWFALV